MWLQEQERLNTLQKKLEDMPAGSKDPSMEEVNAKSIIKHLNKNFRKI